MFLMLRLPRYILVGRDGAIVDRWNAFTSAEMEEAKAKMQGQLGP
jgi:hypothetical protein